MPTDQHACVVNNDIKIVNTLLITTKTNMTV